MKFKLFGFTIDNSGSGDSKNPTSSNQTLKPDVELRTFHPEIIPNVTSKEQNESESKNNPIIPDHKITESVNSENISQLQDKESSEDPPVYNRLSTELDLDLGPVTIMPRYPESLSEASPLRGTSGEFDDPFFSPHTYRTNTRRPIRWFFFGGIS